MNPAKRSLYLPGAGLLKGLAVTGRNFIGSFFRAERMTTVPYPEKCAPISQRFRNFPFLVFDGEDPSDGLRCVACGICEKECPPQAIFIEQERDARGKPAKKPAVFNIDISVCMSCGICAEVCPFDSIFMDREFRLSGRDRFAEMLLDRARLSKPAAYLAEIRPDESAMVEARRTAARESKQKPAKPAEKAEKQDELLSRP